MVKLQPFEDFNLELDSGLVTLTESGKEKIESSLMQDKKKRETLLTAYNIKYEINKIVQGHEVKLRDILEQDKPYHDLLVSYMVGILHNKKYISPIEIEHKFH
ncbi:MAG: hypothetical protein R3321_13515 [Nitrososphaeraceae archaeon]|nr:hypothetical protein [Nitrososphaeraceae archaeon]